MAPIGEYVFAAIGWGPVDHLTVSDNVVSGAPFRLTVHPLDGSGYRREVIAITRNRSDTAVTGNDPVMDFAANDQLAVTDNVQPFIGRGVFAHVIGSCQVAIYGNDVGAATESAVEPASCP